MPKFVVTYEIITPESAEQGDVEEHGFIMPGEWRYPVEQPEAHETYEIGLREALGLCCPDEDAGTWLVETDGRINYATGAEERRSLHMPDSVTSASYDRIKRLCGIRR